jgi:uncharacterized protein YukE
MEYDGGGGTGFAYPQGDPGALNAAADALSSVAGVFRDGAGQVAGAAQAVSGNWTGSAEQAFQAAVGSVKSGLESMAGYHQSAAAALRDYATALSAAQSAAAKAASTYSEASTRYDSTIAQLRSDPPKGASASLTADRIASDAADQLNGAYTSACNGCDLAVSDANHAAQIATARLNQAADGARDTSLHSFVDLMGGPGTALGALGVTMQLKDGVSMVQLVKALYSRDFDTLEKIDPGKWATDVEKVVQANGVDSYEALVAQYKYGEDIWHDSLTTLAEDAAPVGRVPEGLAGVFDVVGKVGMVAGVLSDGAIILDPQSSGTDKVMAGVNLGGIGMAATGTDVVAGALGDAALEGAAAFIPGVGEVLVLGTTAYFAGEFIKDHWGTICKWTDDTGHFIGSVASGAYDTAKGFVSGAVSDGESLLSDINPF